MVCGSWKKVILTVFLRGDVFYLNHVYLSFLD